MTSDLIVLPAAAELATHAPSADAQDFAQKSRAENTKRAYKTDWADFTTWCEARALTSLPAQPVTVGNYLSDLAKGDPAAGRPPRAVATLQRRLAAISQAHKLAGHPSPSKDEWVRTVMKGIRRQLGTAQHRVAPAVTDVLRQWVRHLPDSLLGTRDRALLLLGFAGAFRRSELAGLDVGDVRFVPEGLLITLRRSKTDQEGEGIVKGIPFGDWAETCPVRALKAWLKAPGLKEGPLFRPLNRHGKIKPKRMNAGDIATVIKRTAAAAGFEAEEFSGHSLRAGLVTSAIAAGVDDRTAMKQTGHRDRRTFDRYVRDSTKFRDNAAGKVGL